VLREGRARRDEGAPECLPGHLTNFAECKRGTDAACCNLELAVATIVHDLAPKLRTHSLSRRNCLIAAKLRCFVIVIDGNRATNSAFV
jgi:hypothetical protein